MDTSETYIKMCEKAGEIQKLRSDEDYYRNWENGDFFWATILGTAVPSRYNTGTDVVMRLLDRCSMVYHPGSLVWLPRQDQLQEMLSRETQTDITSWDERGWDVFRENGYEDFVGGKISWEQLWLAFVMKEKYSKVWDGEQWITSNR